jgi:hypothetical protein
MAYSSRNRSHLAVPLSIALAIAALVYGCSFPTTIPPTSETEVSTEVTEHVTSDTPSVSEPVPSTATPTLPPPNQEQTVIDRADETVVGGSPYQRLAQVFTVTQSGYLTHLALPINCQPTAWLTIRIEAASGGAPGGGVLGTQVVLGSELPFYQSGMYTSFTIIAFEDPPPVSAGELYAFTLETSGGDCGLHYGLPGDTYHGGSAFFEIADNPPGWREISNPERDLAFQIFISDEAVIE